MKIAVILPLFSEHALRDYLGINLILDFLLKEMHDVHAIDQNECLIDFLLSDAKHLDTLFSTPMAQAENAGSPYLTYFQMYRDHLHKAKTAKSLKKEGLYDHFFRSSVLANLRLDVFGRQSFETVYEGLPDTLPLLNQFLEDTANQLVKDHYQAILVSVPHVDQLLPGLLLGKHLKKAGSAAKTIFGGSAITLMEDEILLDHVKNGYFDYYVKYSGENKLKGLLEFIRRQAPAHQTALSQKTYVDINRQTVSYKGEFDHTSVPILYSRGCYWGKCTYCTYIYLDSGRFTRKDLEVLLDELAQFSGKPVRISLITEALTPRDARMISQGILDRKIRITWGSFFRVDSGFDAHLFDLLKRSGCVFSAVGVESVNNRILDFFNKGYGAKSVYAFFEEAEKANYRFFQCNFMYGAPMATLEEELENISFISRFRKTIGNIAFFRLEITRKSALGKDLETYGIRIDSRSTRKAIRVDNIPFSITLTDKELGLVERAYAAAADHFIQRDCRQAVQSVLKHPDRPIDVSGMILFEFLGGRYLGSMRSPMVKEIPEDFFQRLGSPQPLFPEGLSNGELMTLFELALLNKDRFFWDQINGRDQ